MIESLSNFDCLGILLETGLYTITALNGHFYLGSTTRSFKRRWQEHRTELKHRRHRNPILQAAWDKYGKDGLVFAIHLRCAPEDCATLEMRAMLELRPHYNLAQDTLAPFRGRQHSEEAKEKCRKIHLGKKKAPFTEEHRAKLGLSTKGKKRPPRSDEWRQKLRIANLGKKQSPETIEKKRQSTIGKKYAPRTAEHSLAISAGKKGKKLGSENHAARKIVCVETGQSFATIRDAQNWVRETKRPTALESNISSCCAGRLKTAYGYTWRYAD